MIGSYVPLYRKYRPQSFGELVGQDSIVKTLSNAMALGKVAHAYLFTGPRGTGKTSTARIFAKSLNCVEGPTVTPCGKCPSCIDITNSNSVDVIEIDAASNRKVEDARNLLEKVQFVPVSGKYKIYIIDEVHMLTTEAFNTLLKTLEEPPKNLVFILATTEAHKVLNTIISRCQRFDFRRVPQELIIGNLKVISEKENIKIKDKALSLIAKKAFGGMRDALGLLDQSSVLSNQGKEISEEDILSLLGSLSEDMLFDLTESLAKKDASLLIELIDKVIQSCEPVNVIRELINYFRNLLIIKTSDDLEKTKLLVDVTENILQAIKVQAEQFEVNETVQIIEKLSEYEKIIKNTSQQHLWLEVALISICYRQNIQVIKDLEDRIIKLEEIIFSGRIPEIKPAPVISTPKAQQSPQPAPAVTQVAYPKPEPVSEKRIEEKPVAQEEIAEQKIASASEDVHDLWKQTLSKIKNAAGQAFFMLGKPVEMSSKRIVIAFLNENLVNMAKTKLAPFEDAAREMFGCDPNIIIRTTLPEDNDVKKNLNKADNNIQTAPVSKPEAPKPKPISQIAIDTESYQELETEIIEKLDDINKNITPVNISDQAKMVLELFNGKVIE
ncbi:MAG TPA: DNA polymerase III subunit gamma/tau [Candidatus Gastranaerophilales bacterium]|nr:DNA polymerase III subunit gamma/tau [Candidatus Gastranaerophilales bacterium]